MPTKKTTESDCPISLGWATFCKDVLYGDDTSQRTLYHILPGIGVQIQQPSAVTKNQPDPRIMLGTLAAFAVFHRKKGVEGKIDVKVKLTANMPGLDNLPDAMVEMDPEIRSFQYGIKFSGIIIKLEPEMTETQLKVSFSDGNNLLGEAVMPVSISYVESTESSQ